MGIWITVWDEEFQTLITAKATNPQELWDAIVELNNGNTIVVALED